MGLLENISLIMESFKSAKLDAVIDTQTQIQETPLDSSWISDTSYNPDTKTMTIDIHVEQTHRRYTYFNISQQLFDRFEAAPSHGTFINKVIKSGFHPFVRG